jgi:alpha-tubulin suppressor-like RCC1 family protein
VVLGVLVSCSGSGNGSGDSHQLGGTVAGLSGSGLVLRNRGDTLAIATDGAFRFSQPVVEGLAYEVTLDTPPVGQSCAITNGVGVMGTSDVTNVFVVCNQLFTVSGTVTGIVGSALALQNNGSDTLQTSVNGSFTFATALSDGAPYQVSVLTEPHLPNQACFVANGSGTVAGADVTNVHVTCGSPVSPITMGDGQTCYLRPDATLRCWGKNDVGQVGNSGTGDVTMQVQIGTATWFSISAGYRHTCGTQTDGTLWCWGSNSDGQLGDPLSSVPQTAPRRIGTAMNWAIVAAGTFETCALRRDGTLWCWGENSMGQLGIGSTVGQPIPVQVGFATDWETITTNGGHTCGLRSDHSLWCWGHNAVGAVGDGSGTQQHMPVQIKATETWTAVVAGGAHTCAIRSDGTLWCWGLNDASQLGIGNMTEFIVEQPRQIGTSTDWVTLSASRSASCASRTDGTMWCWGANVYGQGGIGTRSSVQLVPTQVQSTSLWAGIASGGGTTSGIDTSGDVFSWGANNFGWLGTGRIGQKVSPSQASAAAWSVINGGLYHTCGIRTDGSLWCWGLYEYGGSAATTMTETPTPTFPGAVWTSVSTGGQNGCAIRSNGTLWCWGANANGQLGDGTTIDRAAPVQIGVAAWLSIAGGGTTCGIQSDGSLWCWGYGDFGMLGDGVVTSHVQTTPYRVGTETWRTVDVGGSRTCAVRSDRTLWCWGNNFGGVLGDGTNVIRPTPTQISSLTDWATVSIGQNHTCGTTTGGDILCWGSNIFGESGTGSAHATPFPVSPVGGWASVSADNGHTCATRSDGSLWCWGGGLIGDGSSLMAHTFPTQVSGAWSKISCGGYHSCGIRSDGTLWCWGDNISGQLGDDDAWEVLPQPIAP